jgi:hypothetical protein
VVFRSTMNQAQAELFFPKGESVILTSENFERDAPIWKNKKYVLKKIKGVYSLYTSKKKLLYRGD